MSMKKSAFLLPSYASQCTNYNTTRPRCLPPPSSRGHTSSRGYATHHEPSPMGVEKGTRDSSWNNQKIDPHFWPELQSNRTVPTPYEILQIEPKARYIKSARFYELVKLYHPDRHDHHTSSASSISKPVRLERYRLVVSAHTLLSDPEKRRAYDLYGAGWAGAKTLFPPPDFTMSPEARAACMHNATWQDWENWYDRFNPPKPGDPPRKPQRPVFLSNTAFISMVGVLAALAGVGQATRAHEGAKSYAAMVSDTSERAKGEVNRVQSSKQGLNREERIDYFLRDRDPDGYEEDVRKLALGSEGAVLAEPVNSREDLQRRYR